MTALERSLVSRRHFLGWGAALAASTAMGPGVACDRSGPTTRGSVPDPTDWLVTRWAADPFAMGSYSYLAAGATPDDRTALAAPVGDRLFFAGEATSSSYPATVHGALLSGERAADEVLEVAGAGEYVVVVGAGAAGIAAATALRDAGVDVTVVEARDRVGGRIWTDTSWGPAVDLGASWIHGVDGNPLVEIANDVGAEIVSMDDDDIAIYDTAGRNITAEIPDLEEVLEDADDPPGDGSLGPWIDAQVGDLDPEERLIVDYLITSAIEHELGADAADLHVRALEEGDEFGGGDALLPGGFAALLDPFARDLDVRLGVAVSAIGHDGSGVDLRTTEGTARADRVVVTVPLGVLKAGSIVFSPGLPSAKARAVERLGMGVLDKTVLRFRDVFWDDRTLIGFVPERRGEWVEWLNASPLTGEPILIGFNAGRTAEQFEGRSDGAVVASAMRTLRSAYGD